jgi:hypothetical protein
VIRSYLRASWQFWTKDARYFPVRRAYLTIMAPGLIAIAIYFFAIGYWLPGTAFVGLGAFGLWRLHKLRS